MALHTSCITQTVAVSPQDPHYCTFEACDSLAFARRHPRMRLHYLAPALAAAACALTPARLRSNFRPRLRSTISMSTKEPGVVLGLNAAFQRRVAFEKPLVIGAVNRAAESSGGVGGKGQGAYLAAAAARPAGVRPAGSRRREPRDGGGHLEPPRRRVRGAAAGRPLPAWPKCVCPNVVAFSLP